MMMMVVEVLKIECENACVYHEWTALLSQQPGQLINSHTHFGIGFFVAKLLNYWKIIDLFYPFFFVWPYFCLHYISSAILIRDLKCLIVVFIQMLRITGPFFAHHKNISLVFVAVFHTVSLKHPHNHISSLIFWHMNTFLKLNECRYVWITCAHAHKHSQLVVVHSVCVYFFRLFVSKWIDAVVSVAIFTDFQVFNFGKNIFDDIQRVCDFKHRYRWLWLNGCVQLHRIANGLRME